MTSEATLDMLSRRGQQIGERGGNLARRRLQRGQVYLRKGVKGSVWYGRLREDVLEGDGVRRVYRNVKLGTREELPTRKLAQRELDARLDVVNDPRYRARPTATFAEFAARWEAMVLTQHKPSHQATVHSQMWKYLVPFFGHFALRDIQAEQVQWFISGVKKAPKTVRNLYITLQAMWRSARAWGYVVHDPLADIVLPKRRRSQRFFFTLEEIQRILTAAAEPCRTFYWLAAETGMRAGELCGLRTSDLDLERRLVHVRQSAWHGKIREPKTENAYRTLCLSPQIVEHLMGFLRGWRPNGRGLLFATRKGTPWDSNLLVKRKLRPLLRSLGIQEAGLHAFRHGNASLMDRLGAPLKIRQQRLGHADVHLTLQEYTHVVTEDDVRLAGQLGGILNRSEPKTETWENVTDGQVLVH